MEKRSMFMVRMNQYHENGYMPKVIYRFNAIPSKLPMNDLLHRTGKKKHLKLHMEPKESPHSQDNPKQKEQTWRHHAT